MPALPTSADLTSVVATNATMKLTHTQLRDYLAGVLGTDGTIATALASLGALGGQYLLRTTAYSVTGADRGRLIDTTGTWTLSLLAAASAGAGFSFILRNLGVGTITIDPNGSETVDGVTTLAVGPGASGLVICTGTAWLTLALPGTLMGPGRGGDGAAATPAFSFASDPDTGSYRIGADILGMAAGGAERARITTAGMQVTGLLSGTAVTQTTTDATAGRLLKVGDYGLGGVAPLIGNAGVTDNTIPPGWYRYDAASGSSGGPAGATFGSLTHIRRTAGGGETQSFISDSGLGRLLPGTAFTRARSTGAWSLWRLSLDSVNARRKPNVVQRNHVAAASWISSTSAADINWNDLAWAPELGLFAAVALSGTGSRVMTSPDGITWTSRTSAADNNWFAIAWSPELNLFAAVGQTGTGNRVMTSPDGIVWTIRTSAADSSWRGIAWSPELGLFAAVSDSGTGNRVMTSPDGIVWTIRTSAADINWISIAWSPELSLFAAVATSGTGNRVMTSPDGIIWTIRTSAADNNWLSIAWSPELMMFAAVASTGTGNRVMTSPDGINWTTRTSAADNVWRSIAWAPELGLFVAVSETGTGNRVMTSPDGIVWTTRTSATDNSWFSVAWSPELGLFAAVAVTGTGNRAMTSKSAYSVVYR